MGLFFGEWTDYDQQKFNEQYEDDEFRYNQEREAERQERREKREAKEKERQEERESVWYRPGKDWQEYDKGPVCRDYPIWLPRDEATVIVYSIVSYWERYSKIHQLTGNTSLEWSKSLPPDQFYDIPLKPLSDPRYYAFGMKETPHYVPNVPEKFPTLTPKEQKKLFKLAYEEYTRCDCCAKSIEMTAQLMVPQYEKACRKRAKSIFRKKRETPYVLPKEETRIVEMVRHYSKCKGDWSFVTEKEYAKMIEGVDPRVYLGYSYDRMLEAIQKWLDALRACHAEPFKELDMIDKEEQDKRVMKRDKMLSGK